MEKLDLQKELPNTQKEPVSGIRRGISSINNRFDASIKDALAKNQVYPNKAQEHTEKPRF